MSIVNQSAIREVRDQLMLDTADGEYLNAVTQNLGLQRPPIGFSDDLWRAIGKLLGLHYKQVAPKFEEILATLFGPRKTVVHVFTSSLSIGDTEGTLSSTEDIPQLGTVIIDKGLPTEETVQYRFLDRFNNKIYFSTPLTQNHVVSSNEANSALLLPRAPGATALIVSDADYYNTLTTPFSLIVGQGTDVEEHVSVSAVNTASRTLTTTALVNTHEGTTPTVTQTELKYDFIANTFVLGVEDSSKFPESGTLLISDPPVFTTVSGTTTSVTTDPGFYTANQHVGRTIVFVGNVTGALAQVSRTITASTPTSFSFAALGTAPVAGDLFYIANTFQASAGAVSSVTVGSPLFVTGTHAGNRITFVGNVTPGLANISTNIESNTATVINFSTNLGTAPAAGDLFYIRPRVEYTRNSYADNAFITRKPISYLAFPKGTKVELLRDNSHIATAQATFQGIGWDIIQSDPRHVEILLPEYLNIGDLRTASYLHDGFPSAASTTLNANALAGATQISVTDSSAFPIMGVLTLNTVNYGYEKVVLNRTFVVAGSTNLVLNVTPGGLGVNSISSIYINDLNYAVASNTANTITLVHPLKDNEFNVLTDSTPITFYSRNLLDFTTGTLTAPAVITDPVDLFIESYPSNLVRGDVWNYSDVFPGPYVYDLTEEISYNLDNVTTITQKLAGPTRVVVDQDNFNNSLEVVDASFFPFSGYPFNVRLGAATGNLETVSLTDVNLKQRTSTTTAAIALPGASFIEVNSLGASGGSRFPNSRGYRVLVGRGTLNEEVIYALSTDGAAVPPRIYCEPTVNTHAINEQVELMADVLSVTGLSDVHAGYISFIDRKTRWPTSITSARINNSEIVEMLYDSITIGSSTGLNAGAGALVINPYGMEVAASQTLLAQLTVGSASVTVADTSQFPTTGYPYPLTLGFDTYNQEIVLITNNNTGTNTLTFLSNTRFVHEAGHKIIYAPGIREELNYSSIVGNSVRFSRPTVLKSDHYIGESVIGTQSPISILKNNGYDFPLRMPTDPALQLNYLIDLVRAAGVEVTVIYNR